MCTIIFDVYFKVKINCFNFLSYKVEFKRKEKMLELPQNPTLKDIQSYVLKMKKERGFNTTDRFYECCLLAEECGELISAVRKNNKNGSVGTGSVVGNVADELADVLIYVCSIANMHKIDLEAALRNKEEKNKLRTWKRNS